MTINQRWVTIPAWFFSPLVVKWFLEFMGESFDKPGANLFVSIASWFFIGAILISIGGFDSKPLRFKPQERNNDDDWV